MSEELVAFFKVLADANRLKIIGLLAQAETSATADAARAVRINMGLTP